MEWMLYLMPNQQYQSAKDKTMLLLQQHNNPRNDPLSRSTRVSRYQITNFYSLTPCSCGYYVTSELSPFSKIHSTNVTITVNKVTHKKHRTK